MWQVIQNYKTGELSVVDVPPPALKPGCVLVRNVASLVSAGTEKHMLEMAKKSLVGKALARPDLVRQVITKAKAEGVLETYRQAMNRLDTPVPLGYSCAGIVTDVGAGVEEFVKGDRVACAGSGFASHAEIVSVPQNLCARIPEKVAFEPAAFVAMGGIALEAVRLAGVTLGEKVVVIGLGLLGQITVQLLRAAGCHVFGVDTVPAKVQMALEYGAEAGAVLNQEDVQAAVRGFARQGADAVILMAATPSNEPLELAAEVARERARIIAAGLVGLQVPREPFFDKELELVVSRAWGPGVFDPLYVEKGVDYPYAYTRWTAKRNMEEFLAQLESRSVRVDHLITHRFSIDQASGAYELILKGKEPYIGVLLTYPQATETVTGLAGQRRVELEPPRPRMPKQQVERIGVGVIGAGLFATTILLPLLRRLKGVRLRGVATATGLKGNHAAKKFGFAYCTTDYRELLADSEIDLILVLTRHGSHAHFVTEALRAKKHVYVEKPLAVDRDQLQSVAKVYSEVLQAAENAVEPILFVGFNRRFSPFTQWLKERFRGVKEPLTVHCTVNAEAVPADHWVHDPRQGGGRIIGEVCHFVDLIQFLTGSVPVRVYAENLAAEVYRPSDNVVVSLKMANGAIGSITYVAGGDKAYPRERVEVFGGGAVGAIENFKRASFVQGWRSQCMRNLFSLDRGYRGEFEALLEAIRTGKTPPVRVEDYLYTTLTTFAIEQSLQSGKPIEVEKVKSMS
jgi:predicted dehydrogenase/threonine dehydrogenase-like Zn-dependent dehydrogenase